MQNTCYPEITERTADEQQFFPTTNVSTRQGYLGKINTDDQKTQKAQKLECLKRRNVVYFKKHNKYLKKNAKIGKFN